MVLFCRLCSGIGPVWRVRTDPFRLFQVASLSDFAVKGVAFDGPVAGCRDDAAHLLRSHRRALVVGSGHRVDFGRIVDRAVDVVRTESQSQLRSRFAFPRKSYGIVLIKIC